ncbi:MAG: UDP-2,4-diacetamido-2,4,6-trideoxy-beta-L-altropyranose hydrolase [Proteobacteria bacterium]|nr:UDP-2,4-diacetamido-2,4,6-trideoxy-beta-L-altropyranose hydrolase [Pseudomonadota bacterium]
MNVFFRVDGGNLYSLGMGHVYRCLKFADFLRKKKIASVFVMKEIKGGIQKVEEGKYPIIKLPKGIDLQKEINKLRNICSKHILITDIRGLDNTYFEQLNNCCSRTIYFDDLGDNGLFPHVLINPSVTPLLQKYNKRQPSTKYLIGRHYFILGAGFRRKRNVRKTIKTALVCLGGADPANYTPTLLRVLERVTHDFEIMLILGPAFQKFYEIDEIHRRTKKRMCILRNVPNMGELMYNADIAFVSGGDIALELAYTGTPGFIIPTIEYENTTAAHFELKRVFLNLDDIKTKDPAKSIRKIEAFLDDFPKRMEFSQNAKNFIDGKGLKRIIYELGII